MSTRIRFNLNVSVFILLIDSEGKALFIQRQPETEFQETWSLPAGGLEAEETAVLAAAREANEETGITVQPDDLELVHVIHCNTNGNVWMGLFFKATSWEGIPRIMEPHKHTDMEWRPLNEAPAGTRKYVKQALEMYSEGKMFSAYGW